MNWSGMAFGLCAMLALLGGAGAAFLRDAAHAVVALAAMLLGVAGMCLVLGAGYVAVAVVLLLAVLVPAAALAAMRVAPPPAPDVREGGGRHAGIAVLVVVVFAVLGWTVTRTTWPAAGGPRDTAMVWLGWRLLTDYLPVLGLAAGLLASAAAVALHLLRTRAPRPPA